MVGLNVFGLMVTQTLGSVFRAVLLTTRTASVRSRAECIHDEPQGRVCKLRAVFSNACLRHAVPLAYEAALLCILSVDTSSAGAAGAQATSSHTLW